MKQSDALQNRPKQIFHKVKRELETVLPQMQIDDEEDNSSNKLLGKEYTES